MSYMSEKCETHVEQNFGKQLNNKAQPRNMLSGLRAKAHEVNATNTKKLKWRVMTKCARTFETNLGAVVETHWLRGCEKPSSRSQAFKSCHPPKGNES